MIVTITDFIHGKSYTLQHDSEIDLLGYIDKISSSEEGHVLLVSRLPQRRLVEQIDLDKVESYWMTTQDVTGSIQPSINQVTDLVISKVGNHNGVAFIEGIEWLVSLYGFSDVLNMVMRIKDALHTKHWSVVFVVATDIFDEIESAKWYRESTEWHIPVAITAEEIIDAEPEVDLVQDTDDELPLSEDGSEKLSFLVRIPREGYSKEIARRRILQWRRMGLDVSSAEPALFQDSDDTGFEIYKSVEDKVRKAIELDNRLDLSLKKGWKSEVTKMRFRVRQLTGFDEVESRIDELI